MRYLTILFVTILVGCVPYHQQLYTQQVRTLNGIVASSKRGETLANKVLYQNQLDFENYNIDCGGEITLQRILPKDDQMGAFDIMIVDNTLLIPVEGSSGVVTYSKYYLVWDGKLKIDDANHASVDLIFIQSIPENLPPVTRGSTLRGQQSRIGTRPANWRPYGTREMKTLSVKYISFDLTKLRDAYSNSVTLNLLGLDFEMEYVYP